MRTLVVVERRERFETVGECVVEVEGHGRNALAGGHRGFTCEFVAAVVVGVVRVAFDPAPLNVVAGYGFVQLTPQILILDGLLGGRFPSRGASNRRSTR